MNVMSELQNFSVIRNHMEQKFTVMLGGLGGVYLVNGLTIRGLNGDPRRNSPYLRGAPQPPPRLRDSTTAAAAVRTLLILSQHQTSNFPS